MKLFNTGSEMVSLENVRRVEKVSGTQRDPYYIHVSYTNRKSSIDFESISCGTGKNGGEETMNKWYNEIIEILAGV